MGYCTSIADILREDTRKIIIKKINLHSFLDIEKTVVNKTVKTG